MSISKTKIIVIGVEKGEPDTEIYTQSDWTGGLDDWTHIGGEVLRGMEEGFKKIRIIVKRKKEINKHKS